MSDSQNQVQTAGRSGNPEVRKILWDLLSDGNLAQRGLDSDLERLEREHGESVYSEWIDLLSDLRLRPEEAREHWKKISRHRDSIQRRLGSPVDPRVAMVDYFLEVERRLENPKLVEILQLERARELAYRDELTDLYNYRFFNETLMRELARCRRHGSTLSLLMIDVDGLRSFSSRACSVNPSRSTTAICNKPCQSPFFSANLIASISG